MKRAISLSYKINAVNFWSPTFHFCSIFRAYTQNEDIYFVFTSNCINHLNCIYSALFSLYSGVMHWTSHPCSTSSLKIHPTHKKALLPIKLWLTWQCLSMHHFTGICVCTNSQLTYRDTSMQNLLSPLGAVTFLIFSRFSQSSPLPSLSAIKRGEVFQDLATWSKAIMQLLIASVSSWGVCALRFTEVSTQSPRFQYHRYRSSAVITAKWLRATLSRGEGPMLALGHLGTHPGMAWLCLDAVSQHMLEYHGYCSDLHQWAGISRTGETHVVLSLPLVILLTEATERGMCLRHDDNGSQLSEKLHTGNLMEQLGADNAITFVMLWHCYLILVYPQWHTWNTKHFKLSISLWVYNLQFIIY